MQHGCPVLLPLGSGHLVLARTNYLPSKYLVMSSEKGPSCEVSSCWHETYRYWMAGSAFEECGHLSPATYTMHSIPMGLLLLGD